jgi:DNA primase
MAGGGYDLEEIRRRADIVEIISPHVALRKAGRRLVGLCPFHQERTGSFTVDPETGLWHCFGCKAGGDLFRFVEMIEKVTFAQAAGAGRAAAGSGAPAGPPRRSLRVLPGPATSAGWQAGCGLSPAAWSLHGVH